LQGEYRPWPGKPPARSNHAARNHDSDNNLDIMNNRSSDEINDKYEEEESWEEKVAQTRTITDDEHVETSRWWRKDWNKEEEEVIRKMNQRPTPNKEGKRSTELDASFVVQDWPWSAENAPLIGEYRPWPGNPPARPNHAGGRNSQDQDNLDNQITLSSNGNQPASPGQETKQQAKKVRAQAKPTPPARESTGRAGPKQRVTKPTPTARESTGRTVPGQLVT
jgi:hypothetical protein